MTKVSTGSIRAKNNLLHRLNLLLKDGLDKPLIKISIIQDFLIEELEGIEKELLELENNNK